uniref:RecA family profile 1 domain-containing protein n=1 Tax=Lotharella oceanica TaxID=641309 RepID=A0A7S2X988_9EUKA|mmetsp:Transcript_19835/g.37295  ORF Transcript_19835/g.37295 Transcript_19835/m.37295 type:complete len:272 (+) Transcript_19835:38-853(+)
MQVENQNDAKEEVQPEEEDFEEIEKLQTVGINVSDIKKLKSAGIYTIKGIWQSTMKTLCGIKGMSEAKATKVKEAANKIQDFGFCTGAAVFEKRKALKKISTGSKEWDKLLGGGIETLSITEIFGEFRTGKTQLCHTLAVVGQLPPEMGGGNGKVVYIDTEGTFRPERIRDIADRFGVDYHAVLDNITYARAFTHEHQMELLIAVAAKMIEERYSVLIVDSSTALFRVDFSGRGQLAGEALMQWFRHRTNAHNFREAAEISTIFVEANKNC